MELPGKYISWIEKCISTASFSVQINGELTGFFNSARGLRQGCSLSPFLFVICMNALSKLLDDAAKKKEIGFHPKCEEIRLTHLCFADDLLVFIDGRKESIEGLVTVLKKFEIISGLQASMEKSTIYVAGMSDSEKQDLKTSFPFAEGRLPVKYLGLPLLTKRMSKEDYGPLIERIRTRFTSWNMRCLSYAGRLLLISSVIMSLINFWQAIFPLPSACLKEIQILSAAFLWDGPGLNPRKTKITWEKLCYPKEEGGLGFRSLKDTAKVHILKIIWRLISSKDSLWADWVKRYILKGESFWNVQNSLAGSWILRKMIKVRELAGSYHQVQIISGDQSLFWFDNWNKEGRLFERWGHRGVMELGIPLNATVNQAIKCIRIRSHRNASLRKVQEEVNKLKEEIQVGMQDIHKWKVKEDIYEEKFNTKNTWELIRQRRQRLEWTRNVWFKHATPKHSFIHWLTCLDKLATKDKVKRWNNQINSVCILCNSEEENRNHLFFSCLYSTQVWGMLMRRFMGSQFTTEWEALQVYWKRFEKDKTKRFLFQYALQVTIYNIWLERNRRNHGNAGKNPNSLVKMLKRMIKNRIIAVMEEDYKQRNVLLMWLTLTE